MATAGPTTLSASFPQWMPFLFDNPAIPLAVFRVVPGPGGERFDLEEANSYFARLHDMTLPRSDPLWLQEMQAMINPEWTELMRSAPPSGEVRVYSKLVRMHGKSFSLRAGRICPGFACLDLTDVTEQQMLEDRVRAAQRLENIGLLVSGITHDLNNLLTPGWMAASLLRRRHQDAEDLRLIDLLENSARSASEMIRRIMSTVRDTKSAPSVLHTSVAMKELLKVLRVTLPHSIRIESSIPQQLPPAAIDGALFSQVLLNLAINARDAMPEGGTLTINVEEITLDGQAATQAGVQPGTYVTFVVADTGEGIPAENMAKIFEPFFTTKAPGHGTGLGLPRVREVVERTGGRVSVRSALGQGSEFRLLIPAITGASADGVEEEIEDLPAPDGAMQRIMVVEDYEGLRETLVLLLRANGYDPIDAPDGHEALKILRKTDEKPALLLMDLAMPRTNGEEMLRHLREAGDNTPVIVMTAHGPGDEFREAEERLKELNVSAIMRKPLREAALLKAIRAALGSPVGR